MQTSALRKEVIHPPAARDFSALRPLVAITALPYFQILLWSAIALSLFSAYLFSSNGFQIAHFDSKGHLLVARRLIDNLTPGFKQIGAFWLPLPHLLYLPLVQNDFLYFQGFAALPVSILCFIATVLILFKLIEKLFDSFVAFLGSVLYLINPNVLYLQSTPLTENLSILFLVCCSYFFVLFATERKVKYLWIASLLAGLGNLTRYENWGVFACMGLVLLILDLKERRGWKMFLMEEAIITIPSLLAIGLSFWINWYTTGHVYIDVSYKHTDFQPAQGSFFMAIVVILYTIGNLISYDWIAFILIGGAILFRKRFSDPAFLASLILLAPLFLFLWEYRDNHPTRIRYGLTFLPGCIAFLCYFPARSRLFAFLFAVFGIYVALFSPFSREYPSQLLQESLRDADVLSLQHDLTNYLREHDDGQLILASMGDIAPVLYDLKLPVKRYVHEGAKPYWDDALKNPEKVVGWVFLFQDDQLWNQLHDNLQFHKHFALVGSGGFLELYRRTPDEQFNLKSHRPHPLYDKFGGPRLPGVI